MYLGDVVTNIWIPAVFVLQLTRETPLAAVLTVYITFVVGFRAIFTGPGPMKISFITDLGGSKVKFAPYRLHTWGDEELLVIVKFISNGSFFFKTTKITF